MNFEDKVLALFDNGRRSAVYVAGYQSARAQAASIAAEADRLIAEMAVENAELRERLAAKNAELERVRALPRKWREDGEKEEGDGEMGAAIACWCCANELEAALASPAAEPAVQEEPVGWQYYQDGKWWHGDDRIKDHRKNTEEAGYPIREVYAAPQPAEQQPAPDVAGLVEAAEEALGEIERIIQEAYNSAYPVCCGRPGSECCGTPEPEWHEADQRMMDRLAPHQKALREALAAYRKQGGDV